MSVIDDLFDDFLVRDSLGFHDGMAENDFDYDDRDTVLMSPDDFVDITGKLV